MCLARPRYPDELLSINRNNGEVNRDSPERSNRSASVTDNGAANVNVETKAATQALPNPPESTTTPVTKEVASPDKAERKPLDGHKPDYAPISSSMRKSHINQRQTVPMLAPVLESSELGENENDLDEPTEEFVAPTVAAPEENSEPPTDAVVAIPRMAPEAMASLHIQMSNIASSLSQQSPTMRASASVSRRSIRQLSRAQQADIANTNSATTGAEIDNQDELSEKAVKVIRRVMDKLTGLDYCDVQQHTALDVPKQVDRLITDAMSHENLCRSFVGWCPFW